VQDNHLINGIPTKAQVTHEGLKHPLQISMCTLTLKTKTNNNGLRFPINLDNNL